MFQESLDTGEMSPLCCLYKSSPLVPPSDVDIMASSEKSEHHTLVTIKGTDVQSSVTTPSFADDLRPLVQMYVD